MNPLEKYTAKEIRDEFCNAEAVIREGKGGGKGRNPQGKSTKPFQQPDAPLNGVAGLRRRQIQKDKKP